ncbi:MAG: isopeptide-forming domain-containing fimbrial protein, partial [Acutalibacteraceae bacterium]
FAPVDYKFEQSTNVDTWFGMSLECEFQQTSDGTYKGQDMIFQFKGDDDVWVYIDDVLVLDIGGTHSPREASVNFRTGEVTYPKRNASDGKVSGSEMVKTNLRTLFDSANVSTADFNNSGETNTFKSDSKHNLKFFILERGGSDSYFQLMFNLPKGTPSVTKEVNYSDPDFNDKRDYKFKIEKAIPTGDSDNPYTYQNFSGLTYLLENSDGTSVDGIPLAADGIFTLKAGQTAYFHNIDDGTKFRVTEFPGAGTSKTIGQYTKNAFDTSGNKVTVTVDEDEVVLNNGNKTEYYVALDKNGDIVTAKDGKIVAVDEDGNVVKADNKGNILYTVNGSTVAVDKDGYIVPADENGNKQLYDGSGTIQTYSFQLKSWNDINGRVMGPYELKTSVDQNIRFTNKLQTTGLRINQEVYSRGSDGTETKVDSVSGAVYNFSLRFFSTNADGTTSECGQKDFSISGDKLSTVVMLDKLPAGVSYELWQYYPDDANHRYLSPTFENSEGKTNGGKFVIEGETPGVDSGIKGVLIASSDDSYPNSITVKNIYVEGQQVVFGKTDNKQSVEVGETVTYTITSSIPDTTYFSGYTYKITDTMSNGLTFDSDKGVTAVIRSNNSDITLTKDTDYSFTKVGNGFELNINIMNEKFKVYTNKNIVITYTAVVNNQAVAKISKNSAKLEYSINPADSTKTVITDVYEEVVYSAKIVVDKYKSGDESTKISDVEFYLYKKDGTNKKYYSSGANGVVTWVDSQASATKKTTDNNGAASFEGIADGTYYLQEVKVPVGYNIPAKDTEVIVNGGGVYPDENKLAVIAKVPNNTSVKLPEAGGIGRTILFTVSATLAVTILIAAAIRFKRRRKTAFKPRYSK